jgi:hypothetical protein
MKKRRREEKYNGFLRKLATKPPFSLKRRRHDQKRPAKKERETELRSRIHSVENLLLSRHSLASQRNVEKEQADRNDKGKKREITEKPNTLHRKAPPKPHSVGSQSTAKKQPKKACYEP